MDVEKDEVVRRLAEGGSSSSTCAARASTAARPSPRAIRAPAGFPARSTSTSRCCSTLTPDEIHERLGPPEDVELVSYCHSGSRSELATQILASLGYRASNYRGSWHEWSRDESLPAETG